MLLLFAFLLDDLHKVFKDCNTKVVITVPGLVSNVMEAKTGLQDIKVKLQKIMSKRKPICISISRTK